MSIIATFPPSASDGLSSVPPSPVFHGDRRSVFREVSWDTYQSLARAQTEGHHLRLAYDGRDLEIMTVGYIHEVIKELVGLFVRAVLSWREIAHVGSGEATLHAVDAERGLQADLTYSFEPGKVLRAREALARNSTDPADYLSPDLAVEVDISSSLIDRPAIYAALRMAEVWRVGRDRNVVIEQLQPDGSYAPAAASRFLHVSAEEIHRWLTAEDVAREDAWYRRLNQWAMGLGPVAGVANGI